MLSQIEYIETKRPKTYPKNSNNALRKQQMSKLYQQKKCFSALQPDRLFMINNWTMFKKTYNHTVCMF